jgi:serine/threonine protein kinase
MSTPTSLFCEHCGAANEPQATYCCFCGRPLQESQTASYDAEKGSLLADAMLKERYRIIKPVGQGGMGTVYHAQDTELDDRPVAVPMDQASTWQPYTDTDWGGRCQFETNTFQVSQGKPDRFYHCDENSIYQNFTIEVKMIIVEGDCGGIVLRENSDGTQMYFFDVCADGTYALYRYGANSSSSTLTAHSTNKAINLWGQVNVLAVVANGNNLDLYVNRQELESVSDNSLSMGNIGFAADDNDIATTVAFQDVMIWALS